MTDIKLTPTQRAFLEAVAAGNARRDTRPPYRTYLRDSRNAVRQPVLDGVNTLVRLDFDNASHFDVPYVLTDAGERWLAENGGNA